MIPDHDMHVVRLPHEGETFAYFFTMDEDEGVIAVAKANPWSDDGSARPFVSGVHVNENFRRRGVARRLMTYIERVARLNGMTSLTMWVHKDNVEAKPLYESLGFHPVFDNDNDETLYAKILEPIQEAA